ncbi:DUF6338 family protein [Desulfovirgula thermocuniculi]|uniref:DUF6338 family protein n=1 Tax=Desulfovirgula thermocuniculi TaxID=348842 RepID=UPI000A048C78|nr:DUF6338 family protein [Desulfovirgula thermocuniculi]
MQLVALLQSCFFTLFLPGALYCFLRYGFRGRSQWQFVLESLVAGLVANSLLIAFETFILKKVDALQVLRGLIELGKSDFESFLEKPFAPETVSVLVVSYACCCTAGFLFRWIGTRKPRFSFSLHPESALDIEMFRLRGKKIAPIVVVRLSSGEEVEGICRTYTFTEPREVVLEVRENGESLLRWFKLDASVREVRLRIPAEAERKVASLQAWRGKRN